MKTRLERDSIGSKEVPADAYYGVQTIRCAENFDITGCRIDKLFINSMAKVKKAAAAANLGAGEISQEMHNAITAACDEIISGKFDDQFIIDPVQGGAGTSMNMNINEVIANRAGEILGGELGQYDKVHPNDHVNCGQSTNDVIPTAGKITALLYLRELTHELELLLSAFEDKSKEFDDVVKMGRTHMQDAVPVRLGQEFRAYASVIARDISRLDASSRELFALNLGGTAIGTGLNASCRYFESVVPALAALTGLLLTQSPDLIDATQHLDCFSAVSSALRTCAVNLSKISSDLRLMSSGPRCGFGEINLPAVQSGSSIMPGKINPVIPDVVNQVAFNVIGNDVTITMAVEAAQLELNAFGPVIYYNLFESIRNLTGAAKTLNHNCVSGITANREHCRDMVENSVGIITPLAVHIGYDKAAELAKRATETGESVRALLLGEGAFTPEQIDEMLDIYAMTELRSQAAPG